MRKEIARNFWRKYIRLVCNGAANIYVDNPAHRFTVDVKAGEYDEIADDEYDLMTADQEQLHNIWHKEQRRTAGDILLDALKMTSISNERRENIVELLAECSSHCDYRLEPESRDYLPSVQAIRKVKQPSGTNDTTDMYNWSPRAIYDYLSERIHGQEAAKRAAATLLYAHVELGRRTNAVFCGPSGCGKSEIWRHLAKDYPNIIRIVDASRLSADGWKGSFHLRDIFNGIPADNLQKCGLIVVLDEADKVCCETMMGSGGTDYSALLQNSLLKMLDGDIIEFGDEDRKKTFKVDCSRVSVVLLGTFEKLLQGKTRNSGSIGFGARSRTEYDYSNTDISYDDLISAGMRREIAGRINRIVSLRPLAPEDYKAILLGPVLDDLQASGRYKIEVDEDSVNFLTEQAATSGLGVRWMKSQIVNALDNLLFNDPTAEVFRIEIDPEIKNQEHYLMN